MARETQTGYLVLADISGYTSLVAQTEIEHADMALSFLLETMVEKIGRRLTMGQLEEGAVFAYIEESERVEAQSPLGPSHARSEVHGASRPIHYPAGGGH